MSKRPHMPNGPDHPMKAHGGWSIGANSLTPSGQTELLKHIGRQLQSDYQNVLKEPAPEKIKLLLERLDQRQRDIDDDL